MIIPAACPILWYDEAQCKTALHVGFNLWLWKLKAKYEDNYGKICNFLDAYLCTSAESIKDPRIFCHTLMFMSSVRLHTTIFTIVK